MKKPAKHLEGFMSLPKESWDVLGDMGPFPTVESALEEIEHFRKDPESLLLAAIDKQRESKGLDCFAGVYGLVECYLDEAVSPNLRFTLFFPSPPNFIWSGVDARMLCLGVSTSTQSITERTSIRSA